MSMETYYKNYLSHHGIKGQKCGVRRFQNEDGSYKSGAEGRYDDSQGGRSGKSGGILSKYKEKKAAKKEEKEFRNKINNRLIEYDEEYDKSEEGKKKLKRYSDAIDKLMDEETWDEDNPAQEEFEAAESDYLRSQGRSTANKLLKEYGEDNLRRFLKYERGELAYKMTVDELIEDYGDRNWDRHAF